MHPRRYSQIERALSILDRSATADILRDDHYLLFLFKKTERIVAALYIITGSMSDNEPLKWRIRESGTLFLQHILSFKERSTPHSKEFLSDTVGELAHLLSLLDLAHLTDMVSPMNFSIMKRELEMALDIIEGRWRAGGFRTPLLFEEHFFAVSKGLFSEPKEKKVNIRATEVPSTSNPVDDTEKLRTLAAFERFEQGQKDIHKGHISIKDTVLYGSVKEQKGHHVSAPQPQSNISTQRLKEERRHRILDVLRQRESAMIKDFSTIITGCSEKTVQRLLLEMVRNNVLKRSGARRWSRYSIAGAPGDTEKEQT